MIQGTTPTHEFEFPFDRDEIQEVRVIYLQFDEVVLVKELDDCTIENGILSTTLTQQDTFAFSPGNAKIRIRVLTSENKAVITEDDILVTVEECVDKEVMQ